MATSSRFFASTGAQRPMAKKNRISSGSALHTNDDDHAYNDVEIWECPLGLMADTAIEVLDDDDVEDKNGKEHNVLVDGSGDVDEIASENLPSGVDIDRRPTPPPAACVCDATTSSHYHDDGGVLVSETQGFDLITDCKEKIIPTNAVSRLCEEFDQAKSVADSSPSNDMSDDIPTSAIQGVAGGNMSRDNNDSINYGSFPDCELISSINKSVQEGECNGDDKKDVENPFALFAYQNNDKKGTSGPSFQFTRRSRKENQRKDHLVEEEKKESKRKRSKSSCNSKNNQYVPISALPKEQRARILTKWQSFSDYNAPLEVRRFQVMVAARLHAQCQEPVVKKAMQNLRLYFINCHGGDKTCRGNTSDDKGVLIELQSGCDELLCAQTLSRADPNELATRCLSSVHFTNVKARHIVQASKEILARFNGIVPESQSGLKELTGIGPKLADILSFVNTREAYSLNLCGENDA